MASDQGLHHSLSEMHGSVDTTGNAKGYRRVFAFLGPAYLISVGYMDPGNWATDLAAGSQFGYSLIWVLMMSNLMALLLQNFSARLGIVQGLDLAQATRGMYPSFLRIPLYVLAEISIAACDLAEVLGMAIGLQLLTGIPLMTAVLLTVLDTFLLFYLQKKGMRKMEAFIIALVLVIGVSLFIELFFAVPSASGIAKGFIPTIQNETALYIAIGIIGATVMPHNLYLHSALVQTRKIKRDDEGISKAIRFNFLDSTIALNVAFFVNAAILILAASVFFKVGRSDVTEIRNAHELLQPLLGNKAAPILFSIALIAAGQSSTITGTLAGQVVMEGFLSLRINPLIRRLLTRMIAILPAVFVIYFTGEENLNSLLILSQVILSVQLPFAVIPLIHAVSDKEKMGKHGVLLKWKIIAWLIASLLTYLNIRMAIEQIQISTASSSLYVKWIFYFLLFAFFVLLLFIVVYPLAKKIKLGATANFHGEIKPLSIERKSFEKIAIALDFDSDAERVLSFALSQGDANTEYLLIHVVESTGSKLYGNNIEDKETKEDRKTLNHYVLELSKKGCKASGILGFGDRIESIVSIVEKESSQLLIMGAHRHTGFKDFFYGETVDKVRHKLNIPVLVVNI